MLIVNLLPENTKNNLNRKIILTSVKNISGLFLTALIFVGIILILAKTISINNFNNAIEQATLISREYGGINQDIRKINSQILETKQIQKDYIIWSDFIKKIMPLIPAEISINYFSASSQGKTVSLKGQASTRESLLTFKKNLEGSALFSKVEIPISYFMSRENISFEINLATLEKTFR